MRSDFSSINNNNNSAFEKEKCFGHGGYLKKNLKSLNASVSMSEG